MMQVNTIVNVKYDKLVRSRKLWKAAQSRFLSILYIKNTTLEQVKHHRHLRLVSGSVKGEKDVKIKCCRISAAKETFDNMDKILKDRKLNVWLRLRIRKCDLWSV